MECATLLLSAAITAEENSINTEARTRTQKDFPLQKLSIITFLEHSLVTHGILTLRNKKPPRSEPGDSRNSARSGGHIQDDGDHCVDWKGLPSLPHAAELEGMR